MDDAIELTPNNIPKELATDLLSAYKKIKLNFYSSNYVAMHAIVTQFTETTFQILEFLISSKYSKRPQISNIISLCEQSSKEKYSQAIRVVIPRVTNALHCLRSERGAIHKSEISPNYQDAVLMMNSCDWVVAELIRLYSSKDQQTSLSIIHGVVAKKIPFIEEFEDGTIMIHNDDSTFPDKVLCLLYRKNKRLKINEVENLTQAEYPQLVSSALNTLKKKGYVHKNNDGVIITAKGIIKFEERIKQWNPSIPLQRNSD